jgi:hypothetical protein
VLEVMEDEPLRAGYGVGPQDMGCPEVQESIEWALPFQKQPKMETSKKQPKMETIKKQIK